MNAKKNVPAANKLFEFKKFKVSLPNETKAVILREIARRNILLGRQEIANQYIDYTGLALLQQGIEAYLKALLYLKNDFSSQHKHHNLSKLFHDCSQHYKLEKLSQNNNFKELLFQIGGNNFSKIRYGEGSLIYKKQRKGESPTKVMIELIQLTQNIFEEKFEYELSKIT